MMPSIGIMYSLNEPKSSIQYIYIYNIISTYKHQNLYGTTYIMNYVYHVCMSVCLYACMYIYIYAYFSG